MSSFFEPPPPPEPQPESPRPLWAGARDAVLGKTVALNLVLGRSEKAALWIPSLTAYGHGFEFDLEIRHRLDDDEFDHAFMWPHHPRRRDAGLLRLGIQFADGRKATNLDERMPFRMLEDPDLLPDGPVLSPSRGGGGGGGRWRHGFWVWPLPPEGPLAFVCEWPVAGVAETRSEIDSALVRDAGGEASVLWPDEERGAPAE